MPSIIYGFPSSDWECEKCNFRNVDTDPICHHCNAPRRLQVSAARETPMTTRLYREPREVGINALPILTVVLCLCTVIAICVILYFLLA